MAPLPEEVDVRFVLVHGGFHGAWCWNRLVPELENLGHDVVAVDLPGAGGRLAEKATFAAWRGALREVIDDGDVLVGHSMGGFAISLAADEVPERIGRLVYLAASVPIEGSTIGTSTNPNTVAAWAEVVGMPYEDFTEVVELPVQGPCLRFTRTEATSRLFYHDCTPADQEWAFEHLTPLALELGNEPFHLPRFWSAPIPRDFVVCTDDRTHQLRADQESMKRLGLTTSFAIRSSHSPFVSRPVEAAGVLDRCARGTLR
jgi:pimeloyl-ACP methyl ester carboxylesterase